MKPVMLAILDGVGLKDAEYGNALKKANPNNFNYLWENFPHSRLVASGEEVGLPKGTMGNSEVGHLNIGAGRLVYQPLELINAKIKDETFFSNDEILSVINHVKNNKSKLHIFGLMSDAGVHSVLNHLYAIMKMLKDNDVKDVYYHFCTDGRDTPVESSLKFLSEFEHKQNSIGIGKVATISGRYYAMDRDNRWDRIEKAYNTMANGIGKESSDYKKYIKESHKNKITDEFITPVVIDKNGTIEENDGIIVFNYRPDRLREIFTAITNPNFKEFKVKKFNNIKLVTMMKVSEDVIATNAFKLETLENTLGEYVSNHGLTQLRIAETEKYAHVTYFFDGGLEKKLNGCKRILIPSPKVATYDLQPEMSATEITDNLLNEIENYNLIILNFANGDMLGHTGNMEAAVKGLECVNYNLGRIIEKIKQIDGTLIVTADHGNCEEMLDNDGNLITSHTTNLVPFIIMKDGYKLKDGKLGDIAPTILKIMNLPIPKEMTGSILIEE